MTTFDQVAPTEGSVSQSYELIFDIARKPVGNAQPTWVNVPDFTALNPQAPAQLQAITTYAHKGKERQTKIGSAFTLGFNILKIRDQLGEFQPEFYILKDAHDAVGGANEVLFRYYDALGADIAYQGTALVQWDARPENGATGPGWEAFTLTGAGDVVPITNPIGGALDTDWTVAVTGAPTGGSFQLRVNDVPTAPIAYNANAAAISAAINGIQGVTGLTNVTTSGTGPFVVTFAAPGAVVKKGVTALTGGTTPDISVTAS